jgi:hypothetical protein
MYLWDIPFVIIGLLYLLRKKEGNWWLVPLWLLIGIIPAATARETPHALRIEASLPTFQILSAYGAVVFLSSLKRFRNLIGVILIALLLINFAYFYHDYSAHYPSEYSGEWQYGYKQSIAYVESVKNNYDYIQITNALGRPYIYYLFYTKTDPGIYRQTAKINRDPFGFVTINGFGKYIFPDSFDNALSKKARILYISTPYNLPKNIKILKTFNLLNGQPILVAYTI